MYIQILIYLMWLALSIILLFVGILILIWRQRERRLTLQEYAYESNDRDAVQAMTKELVAEFEQTPYDTIANLERKETCDDIDPVLSYYSKEYKNRWKEVKPHINSVGFIPTAKRCLYPGAPCEWQKESISD